MARNAADRGYAGYLETCRRIATCFTDAPLTLTRSLEVVGARSLITLPPAADLRLVRYRGAPLLFRMGAHVAAAGEDVTIQAYRYEIFLADGTEVALYHWHPFGRSGEHAPHAHFPTPGDELALLLNVHWPTGLVRFVDIGRLLLSELGVVPRRADWVEVLGAVSAGSAAS